MVEEEEEGEGEGEEREGTRPYRRWILMRY